MAMEVQDMNETGEPEAMPPEPPKKPPTKYQARTLAQPPMTPMANVARDIENSEALELREWIKSLGGDGEIKVQIQRLKPNIGPNGENISGTLETVDSIIDEEYIRDTWGGGTFLLRVSTPQGANGAMKYFKGRQVKIAGPPKVNGVELAKGSGPQPISAADDERVTIVDRAMEMQERAARRAEERADAMQREAGRNNGVDHEAIRMFTEPLQRANDKLTAELAEMRREATKAPPKDEFRDRILESMLGGESQRVETLRATYEARIDKLREEHDSHVRRLEERHADAITRIETRHERELDRARDELKVLEARHVRELQMADKQGDAMRANGSIAFDARLDAAKSENARLERDLTSANAKIAALEAIKQQTIGDKADELMKVKEALDGIGGGGDGEPAWYEKVISAVGNSQIAADMINKVTGGGQPAPEAQPQLPPPGVPFQVGDGKIYVRRADGQVVEITQQQVRQQQALASARAKRRQQKAAAPATMPPAEGDAAPAEGDGTDPVEAGVADEQPQEPQGRPPDAAEMKIAISFLESAVNSNKTTPEDCVRAARSLIPTDVVQYLQSVGFEKFLSTANLPVGSILTQQRGRNFIRAMARILATGSAE
jgi:hypothetical protein